MSGLPIYFSKLHASILLWFFVNVKSFFFSCLNIHLTRNSPTRRTAPANYRPSINSLFLEGLRERVRVRV